MKISVLGSGSGGNCTYVASEKSHILIDAGFGPRSIERRFRDAGIPLPKIDAVLLTHGHIDHTRGITSLLKKYRAPVYLTAGTMEELALNPENCPARIISRKDRFPIGDLDIQTFPTIHDSAEPVGFQVTWRGITGTLATDLGKLTRGVIERLNLSDWIIMESNHDEELLRIGPYPLALKRRILGERGHISNQVVAHFLEKQFNGMARHIFLAHISKQNNVPSLVMGSAEEALERRNRGSLFRLEPRLYLTHQSGPSEVLEL